MLKVICDCGCETKANSVKFEMPKDKNQIASAVILCPNCSKNIALVLVDLNKQKCTVVPKEDGSK